MPNEFLFDVFLSHHSGDKPRVHRLAERLKAAGLRVWFDEWSIAPGEDIYLAIERGLETARTLVLFLSPAALGSDWVRLERGTALFRDPVNTERRFLPVLLEDCDLPDTLRRYRYIDLRKENEESFVQFLAACRGDVPPPVSVPLPAKRKRPPSSTRKPALQKATHFALLYLGSFLVGAVLLWLLVAKAELLVPSQGPFSVTVFVHGEGGVQDIPLRGQGFVVLDLGPDRRREAIGGKGEAHFSGIPSNFGGQKVPVWLEAEGFELVSTDATQRLDKESLYLTVKRLPATLRGRVQDPEGQPVAGTTKNAKAADLYGKVVENEIGGTPMAKVDIGASGVKPTASDSLGLFHLALPRRQPGETISLTVHKGGYEVVNDVQLEVTLRLKPEDWPLTLLLCKPKLCEEMRRRYYRLKGLEAADANYQYQLRELEQSKQATVAERDRLKEERDAARAAAEKAAEELARVRPAESSEIYQKALRLFLDGRLNEALSILDETKLQASLSEARNSKEQAEREVEQVVQGYLLRGQLLTLQFQFTEAERAYQTAVDSAPENVEANFAFAEFASNQKHYAQATAAFQRCRDLAKKRGEEKNLAGILNNLGILLSEQNKYEDARASYDEALKVADKLAEKNPDVYLPDVAKTLNNLGNLLRKQNKSEEARKSYGDALASYQQLAKKDPDTYLPEVAAILNNLGGFLSEQNRPEEARKSYNDALIFYRQLAQKNPDVYLPEVAMTLDNLGVLLVDQKRFGEAKKCYDEAITHYRQLAKKNPEGYLPEVAVTLNNLGVVLSNQNHLKEARKSYDEALDLYRGLADKDPDVYLPKVAMTLNNLGVVLSNQNHLKEARKSYDEALDLYRGLADKDPNAYRPIVASSLNNLGNLLSDQKNPEEAQKSYEDALASYRQLAKQNPERYLPDLAKTLYNLGVLLSSRNRFAEARKLFTEAITIVEPFTAKDPESFQDLLDALKQELQRTEPKESRMRTLIILLGGFVLWAACLGIARLLANASPSSMTTATTVFIPLWLVVAAANLWIEVSRAGYSFQEELPIFLLIFSLPVAVAVFVKWKFL